MQYKIPVQIENEDTIIGSLSLRQIIIIVIGIGLGYGVFSSLQTKVSIEIALLPAGIIWLFFGLVALFKYSEMNFINFIFAFIRYKVNLSERKWIKGVDSFSPLEIGYITQDKKVNKKVDFGDKLNKMKTIDEQLEKI